MTPIPTSSPRTGAPARPFRTALARAALPALVSIGLLGGAATAAAETELLFATTLPEKNPIVEQVFRPWVEQTNAEHEGLIRLNIQNGPTIASHTNVYERVNNGIIDMGWSIFASAGVPFPRTSVSALPFLVDDSPSGSDALWKTYQTGLLDEDFANAKLVSLVALPVAGIHSTTPIESLDDLQGLKIRSADKISSDMLTALGATPVGMATAESYQSVEQGVLDGLFVGWTGLVIFKLEEVTTDHLNVNLASGPAGVFINSGVYETLDDEQKAALESAGTKLVESLAGWYGKITGIFEQKVTAMPGHTVRDISDEEKAKWREMTRDIAAEWAKETPNGEAILEEFTSNLAAGASK